MTMEWESTEADAAERREFHRSIRWTIWQRLTKPFRFISWRRKHHDEFKKRYPKGLTKEQTRRLKDLGDPYAEYAPDDPRRYNIYGQGDSGYVPPPGRFPYFVHHEWSDARLYRSCRVFERFPDITREGLRRYIDLGDPRERYDSDDPRRYGIYGLGKNGYTPSEEDLAFRADSLTIWKTAGGPPRRFDTTILSNEQYRRLLDLGDPDCEYFPFDSRNYGIYHLGHQWKTEPDPLWGEPFTWEG